MNNELLVKFVTLGYLLQAVYEEMEDGSCLSPALLALHSRMLAVRDAIHSLDKDKREIVNGAVETLTRKSIEEEFARAVEPIVSELEVVAQQIINEVKGIGNETDR